tara:strand:+ start:25976 stop:27079 length:1104 start_codon:yes stop_codon:yes gene_type:complete
MDKKFYLDVPNSIYDFLNKLRKDEIYLYKPSLEGVTKQGNLISLGYSCYALKIYFMTSKWEELNQEEQDKWIQYINSFQKNNNRFPNNSYIDQHFLDSYSNFGLTENIKYGIKSVLNNFNKGKYDTKNTLLRKSINAETKQALATLSELNYSSDSVVEFPFKDSIELLEYLNSLNWDTPWTSGAQYSSLCVFSKTQHGKYKKELEDFIGNLSNKETGSYHSQDLSDKREIINGAMKVISGLDWLDIPIHHPKKLIDFCLSNVPHSEGCDVVDFVYVLYKCSRQVDYKKDEINNLFIQILDQIKTLYNEKDGAFSYFKNKSQTHYYGVEITKGLNRADIHGSVLCLWAILMILDNLEIKDHSLKIIKP